MKACLCTLLLLLNLSVILPASAVPADDQLLEQAVSETLDLWREGRYEQLFDRLSHRGRMSRERFAEGMRQAATRPACCWQKMENFTVVSLRRTDATVYVKVGLEGLPGSSSASTREFRLTKEAGHWRMQLSDIAALAGISSTGKRHRR